MPDVDKKEQKIQDACRLLSRRVNNGQKPDIKNLARELDLPYTTLYNRFTNIHKSRTEAIQAQLYSSPLPSSTTRPIYCAKSSSYLYFIRN
ncbi:hypothetical protein R3P38DRAFT_3205531 [Favolaschia claudopus]|uniref:HTH psq-type domain-containing protein n=1 Tax=Favolaschia claudopus TaxID=2862362 RepID=A0AAW0AN05_9AGAR